MKIYKTRFPMVAFKYLSREILHMVFWLLLLLCMLFLLMRFSHFTGKLIEDGISLGVIFEFSLLNVSSQMVVLLPFAFMTAVSIVYARMGKDNELIAWRSAGFGEFTHIRILFILAVIFAIINAIFSFYISPWSYHRSEQLTEKMTSLIIASIDPEVFRTRRHGEEAYYFEKYGEDKVPNNVFMFHKKNNDLQTIVAKKASITQGATPILQLEHGMLYQELRNKNSYEISTFSIAKTKLQSFLGSNANSRRPMRMRAIATAELLQNTQKRTHLVELHWRIHQIVFTIILPLLAQVLLLVGIRHRILIILAAILSGIIYNNLLAVTRSLLEQSSFSPTIGFFSVHVGVVSLLFLLIKLRTFRR